MIVVSDSTPLITLMKAEQLSILHHLFGEFEKGLLNAYEAEKALERIENSGRHISRRLLQNARNAIRGETKY